MRRSASTRGVPPRGTAAPPRAQAADRRPPSNPRRPAAGRASQPARSTRAANDRPHRCFIAAPLPARVQEACAAVGAALRSADLPVRWVRPGGIHLTLKFLGDVAHARLPQVSQALDQALAGTRPFTLRTDHVGVFGGEPRPRVLWLGLAGDVPALRAAQRAVDLACAEVGLPREPRAYHPHLTLGRFTGRARLPPGWLADVPALPAVAWCVEEVHLYASHLKATGAVHEILAVCSLVTNEQPPDAQERS